MDDANNNGDEDNKDDGADNDDDAHDDEGEDDDDDDDDDDDVDVGFVGYVHQPWKGLLNLMCSLFVRVYVCDLPAATVTAVKIKLLSIPNS